MKVIINQKNTVLFLIFFIFFGINIGSKEIFRVLNALNLTTELSIPIIFSLALLILVQLFYSKSDHRLVFASGILLVIYLFILSIFGDLEYGFEKLTLGILVPLSLFSLIKRYNYTYDQILNFLILTVFIVCIYALYFKLRNGFFIRGVQFGLLGPIPFGWISGMAFIAAAIKNNRNYFDVLVMVFMSTMILWSGSKGPLFTLLIINIIFFNRIYGKKLITKVYVGSVFLISISFLFIYGEELRAISSFISLVDNPEAYIEGAGSGSIGSRTYFLDSAWKIFLIEPFFGQGFGNFSNSYLLVNHNYPHNIIAEIGSETGIVGICFLVFFIYSIKVKNNLYIIGLFGIITLMFSGDFSYFRYALFPYLLSSLDLNK